MKIDIFNRIIVFNVIKKQSKTGLVRSVKGGCLLEYERGYYLLTMPDGTRIPHQIDLTIESNLSEVTTATVKLHISGIKQLNTAQADANPKP
jgi:hypothetical protein